MIKHIVVLLKVLSKMSDFLYMLNCSSRSYFFRYTVISVTSRDCNHITWFCRNSVSVSLLAIQIWLKALITRSIDFWIFASIAQFRRNQRSSWSSSLSSRIRLLTKFNQMRNQKLKTSSSSLSRCALFARRSIIQRTSIVSNSISNEIVINSTKNETIETTNANEETTTTTKNSIRKSMTKKKSTKFTSSSISRFWRSWASCLVKSRIEFWTRSALNTAYETNRRLSFTRRSRNSFLSTI